MVCHNCGANSTSNLFCTVCGQRFSVGGMVKQKKPIISSSFTTGTTFAIIGCVCYLLLMFMGISDGDELFVCGFANTFIGTSEEGLAWIYTLGIISTMIILPIGLVMFSSGADRGGKSGINAILTALIIYLICSAANMIYFCSVWLPRLGDILKGIPEMLKSVPDGMVLMAIAALYIVLFLFIVEPILTVIWISTLISGVNCIGRNINFKSNSKRPSAGAAALGKTLGVMRLLFFLGMVIVIGGVIGEANSGMGYRIGVGDLFEEGGTKLIMILLGYLGISIMMIAFGAFFNRMRQGENYYSDTSAQGSASYVADTYSPAPEKTQATYTPPTAGTTSANTAKVVERFCKYCGKKLPESRICSCVEARMAADREMSAADHVVTESGVYNGPSRVNINIRQHPAPDYAESGKTEE